MSGPVDTVTLRRRGVLIALLSAAILFFAFLILWNVKSGWDHRRRLLEVAEVKSQIQAQLIAEHASGAMEAVDLTLQCVAEELERAAGPLSWSRIDTLVRRKTLFLPQIVDFCIFDAAGARRYDLEPGSTACLEDAVPGLIKAHRDRLEEFVVARSTDGAGRDRLLFSRPALDGDGRFGGMAVAAVDPDYFQRRYREYTDTDVDAVILYGMNGTILSSYFRPRSWAARGESGYGDAEAVFASVPRNLFLAGGLRSHPDGNAIIALYQLNHFPFHVGLAHSRDRVLAPFGKEAVRLGVLTAVAGGMILLLGLTARSQINRRRRAESALDRSRARERLLDALRRTAVAVGGAGDAREAAERCLQDLCPLIAWPLGCVWLKGDPETGDMAADRVWFTAEGADVEIPAPPPACPVVERDRWMDDLRERKGPSWILPFAAAGMRTGVLRPVRVGERIAAVLGVFTDRVVAEDGAVAGVIHQAAAPLEQAMERFRAEAALVARESLYHQMFEAHSAVKLLIDPRDGSIIDANPAACRFYGYPKHRLLRKRVTEINALDPDAVREALDDVLQGRRNRFEFPHALATGEVRQVEVHSGPVPVRGRVLLYSIVHDITDRKRLQEELIQAKKTEAAAIIAGGIAHDFNNLLAVILGNIDMARVDLPADHPVAPLLTEAQAGAHRARGLIDRFMTLSAAPSDGLNPVRLEPLILRTADAILGGTGITHTHRLSPDLRPVLGNAGRLTQVLEHVLVNAREAMPGGGRVEITAGNLLGAAAGPDQALPEAEGDRVALTITDTGPGIPEAHLSRVFDAYFSTKERGAQKGMGLGLAMAQAIVRRHRGRMEIRSAPGRGTTVRILLPAAEAFRAD